MIRLEEFVYFEMEKYVSRKLSEKRRKEVLWTPATTSGILLVKT